MKNCLYYLFVLIFAQALLGCKTLTKIINEKFPPVHYSAIQCSSILQSSLNLAGLKPGVGIHIEREFLIKNLKIFIQREISEIKSSEFNIKDQNITIELVDQGINPRIDFDIILKNGIELVGYLEGYIWVASSNENLIFKGSFKRIEIEKIRISKKIGIGKKGLGNLVSNTLNKYLDNINGILEKKAYTVNVGWGKIYQVELNKLSRKNTQVSSNPVGIYRSIEKNTIRISSQGVSVMGQFSYLDTPQPPVPEIEFRNQNNNKNDCQREFEKFNADFDKTWAEQFEKINFNSKLVANISKVELAKIINDVLKNKIEIKQEFEIPYEEFNSNMEIKKENIDCSVVKTEFNFQEFSYHEFNFPEFSGENCDRDCGKFDLHCKARVALCKTEREAKRIAHQGARESARIAYQTARESARIAHQGARESARIIHQGENRAKEAACVAKRELTGLLDVGVFKGNIFGNIKCNIAINSFFINDNLSNININYLANAQAELNSYLEIRPQDLGYVFLCYSSYNSKSNSKIDLRVTENFNSIQLTNYRQGDNLHLGFKLNSLPYKAEIDNNPLHKLLIDPELRVKCPYFYSTLLGVSTTATTANFLKIIKLKPELELLLLGKVKGSFDIDQIDFVVKPISFKINENEIKSTIYWNEKSIKFESSK